MTNSFALMRQIMKKNIIIESARLLMGGSSGRPPWQMALLRLMGTHHSQGHGADTLDINPVYLQRANLTVHRQPASHPPRHHIAWRWFTTCIGILCFVGAFTFLFTSSINALLSPSRSLACSPWRYAITLSSSCLPTERMNGQIAPRRHGALWGRW